MQFGWKGFKAFNASLGVARHLRNPLNLQTFGGFKFQEILWRGVWSGATIVF